MANPRKKRRKTTTALEKKIEALENQGFAQRLVLDELEKKIELLEQQVKEATLYTAPSPYYISPPLPIQPIGCQHVFTVGIDGISCCINCGYQQLSAVTITCSSAGTNLSSNVLDIKYLDKESI